MRTLALVMLGVLDQVYVEKFARCHGLVFCVIWAVLLCTLAEFAHCTWLKFAQVLHATALNFSFPCFARLCAPDDDATSLLMSSDLLRFSPCLKVATLESPRQ